MRCSFSQARTKHKKLHFVLFVFLSAVFLAGSPDSGKDGTVPAAFAQAAGRAAAAQLAPGALEIPAGQEGTITQGALRAKTKEGKTIEFPLKHTDVAASVSGFLARVEVTQVFQNPYLEPIEAVYVFPLPPGSAVDDMVMKIGDRTIRGVIKKREEAKKIYEQAKAEGKTASLLEQERPNIFTQSVANIVPGAEIRVMIRYVQDLKLDWGVYEFNFPMVVGPRYIPGEPAGRQAGGWSPDTAAVPDASRITPPVLPPEFRSAHDISLELALDAGVPIKDLASPSHDIEIERQGKEEAVVRLKDSDSVPNRDFILRWRAASDEVREGILTHYGAKGGFFLLILQPRSEFALKDVTGKEMVFVVDTSGSMSGFPIEKAKEAITRCLQGVNPQDSFQVIDFNIDAEKLAAAPMPATPENIRTAVDFVKTFEGSGGTEMMTGIRACLDFPPDPQRMRIVFFLTDGYIGNEDEILQAIQKRLPKANARIFPFGVGTSVNHYLLDKMAEVGLGRAEYVRPDEASEEAIERFYERIRSPYLTDIRIDWNGLRVSDAYPPRIPDLFAGQPLFIFGRYTRPGSATIFIRGKVAGVPVERKFDVVFPEKQGENEVLESLWARRKIEDLMSAMVGGEKPEIADQVTSLALDYRLMSKYTSFVAVEEKVVTEPGKPPVTVQVPVEMPEMVSYEGVFGEGRQYAETVGLTPGVLGVGQTLTVTGEAPLIEGESTSMNFTISPGQTYSRPGGGGKKHRAALVPPLSLPRGVPTAEDSGRDRFVRLQDSKVEGKLFPADARSAFREHRQEIDFCYLTAARENPTLKGAFEIEIGIDFSGKVQTAVVRSAAPEIESLANCLKEKMKGWIFPMPRDGNAARIILKLKVLPFKEN